MKKWASLAIAAAFVLGPMTAHADMKALEEAAKKEGELTWYVAHYTSEGAEELGAAFTKMYGIKVNVVRTTAQVAYQRLTQDIKNNQTNCDVFSSTDIGHYTRLKAEGRLEKYIPEETPKIAEAFRGLDPDGYFHTTSGGTVLLSYNSSKVKDEDAPKKWTDLLDPKWKGKVSTGHPAFSGYVGTWVLTHAQALWLGLFREAGEEQAADRPLDQRHGDGAQCRRAPGRRRRRRLDAVQRRARQSAQDLYPSDGAVLIISPSAIVKGTKHPNAAKLFMEFLYSIEASQIDVKHFTVPMRPEVKPGEGARSVTEVKTVKPTVAEIDKGIPEVIEQWRDTFGN